MLFGKDDEFDADKSVVIKLIRKIYAVSPELDEGKFFTIQNGVRAMTPLLVVLLVIESTDILFAVDSIPAVFSVTTDSFIVFTSNIFAILGLRSLYFVLSSLMSKFQYMKYSLFVLLVFIGVEMLLPAFVEVEIPILVSLLVIVVILGVGILVSILMSKKSGVDE
jgi:tellurite resistance protein TerC